METMFRTVGRELVPECGAHVSECGCFQQLAGDSCPHSLQTLKVLVDGSESHRALGMFRRVWLLEQDVTAYEEHVSQYRAAASASCKVWTECL